MSSQPVDVVTLQSDVIAVLLCAQCREIAEPNHQCKEKVNNEKQEGSDSTDRDANPQG